MGLSGTLLFHLNLGYSSIEPERRGEVLQRCYRPLLELPERVPGLVLTLEAPAATLELAAELDPSWIERLQRRLAEGTVELVGSGEAQIAGPLVPESVNLWNQRLGAEAYERLLGVRPRTALVNELAWSQGLVDAYLAAGYRTLVCEWDNPRRSHPEWEEELRFGAVWTRSPRGRRIEVLFADTVAFQKFQRAVTGELDREEYLAWVAQRQGEAPRHLFLYAGDAEVFDHRPGRFAAEPALAEGAGEWQRMAQLLRALTDQGVRFTTPERVRREPWMAPRETLVLSSAADPIPVKKQPKYNVTRWALTGWDDLGANARCFAAARRLEEAGCTDPEPWRELCRAWASDLRTHLTPGRLGELRALPAPEASLSAMRSSPGRALEHPARIQREPRRIRVDTGGVRVSLLTSRGLAIETLAFPEVAPEPLVGTLPHGHFDDVAWAADFYSGHAVLDVPAERRLTDLERVAPQVIELGHGVEVRALVETPLGTFEKRVRVLADALELSFGFSALGARPASSLRAGFVTLLPGALALFGEELDGRCANGGAKERFPLGADAPCFDHGASVSPLVSARAALGATTGELQIGGAAFALHLSWPQELAPALPLLLHRRIGRRRLVRVRFSLGEIDETLRPGHATFPDFHLRLATLRRHTP